MVNKYAVIERKLTYLIVILLAMFYLFPYILFGTNSIITIHDNLDSNIAWLKMFKDNGLFFKFDAPTKALDGMSTLHWGVNFSIMPILFYIFNDYSAYVVHLFLCIFTGFLSMNLLLKRINNIDWTIRILISASYAILPVHPASGMAVASLPLIAFVFLHFMSKNNFSWKILFVLLYPVISSFGMVGIFILGFWFLGTVILTVKDKKININLLIGFILLCIGYIIVDMRLFYVMFILKTPLKRSVRTLSTGDIINQLQLLLRYFLGGGSFKYHAPSFSRNIIIPVVFFVSSSCLIMLISKIIKQTGKIIERVKAAFSKTSNQVKLLFLIGLLIVIIDFIAALYQSRLLESFFKKYIPLLAGFNWGRVWIFNRVLWYIVFALSLQQILKLVLKLNSLSLTMSINQGKIVKKVTIPITPFFSSLCVLLIIILQIIYIAKTPAEYNDSIKIWLNKIEGRSGVANQISYKEFFAKDLFDSIKEDISYSNEPVVALGYHPSVLMYNRFNCIDGYNSLNPLSYMQKFRTLIAPELEINEWARGYYDNWGGRMYLFNSELSYWPTRDKNILPVKLNIDMDVFKYNFNGKYILSRAEIANFEELGLDLVNRYYDEKSIYTIYVYTIKNTE